MFIVPQSQSMFYFSLPSLNKLLLSLALFFLLDTPNLLVKDRLVFFNHYIFFQSLLPLLASSFTPIIIYSSFHPLKRLHPDRKKCALGTSVTTTGTSSNPHKRGESENNGSNNSVHGLEWRICPTFPWQ